MRIIRAIALSALMAYAWRVLHGRVRMLIKQAPTADRGTHTSAASAANEGFRDDRDVIVGEQLSAIGMRPGAR